MQAVTDKAVAYRHATTLVRGGWLYLHPACFAESGEALDERTQALTVLPEGEVCAWCVDDNGDALPLDGTRNY